jgi:hypothetical protein
MDFRTELKGLLNRFSIDSKNNTADYILAEYLNNCLDAYNKAVAEREKYTKNPSEISLEENLYGVQLKPPIEPKPEPNKPIPAPVGNNITTGWSNPFAGTSWGA